MDAKSEKTDGEKTDGEKTTIRFAWWGGQERADMTNEAVELFMEKEPGYRSGNKLFTRGTPTGKICRWHPQRTMYRMYTRAT